MRDPYQIVLTPVISEKSTAAIELANQYSFKVRKDANKVEIRQAVEAIFDVRVQKVNTLVRKGKKRRVRAKQCRMPDWKKAVVKLHPEDKIDVV